jgi:hypothetical protein
MPIGALRVDNIARHVGQGSDFVASMRAELTDVHARTRAGAVGAISFAWWCAIPKGT